MEIWYKMLIFLLKVKYLLRIDIGLINILSKLSLYKFRWNIIWFDEFGLIR